MADVNGTQLAVGDTVEIVQMDDPAYRWLVGERATVAHIPEDETNPAIRETQVNILLDTPQAGIPGLATHQAWLRRLGDVTDSATDSAPVSGQEG